MQEMVHNCLITLSLIINKFRAKPQVISSEIYCNYHFITISYKIWANVAEGDIAYPKAFSEPHPGWTLELSDASQRRTANFNSSDARILKRGKLGKFDNDYDL